MRRMFRRRVHLVLVSLLLVLLGASTLGAQPATPSPSEAVPLDTPTKKELANPYNKDNQLTSTVHRRPS
jgi:hypothetical protein